MFTVFLFVLNQFVVLLFTTVTLQEDRNVHALLNSAIDLIVANECNITTAFAREQVVYQ